MKTCQCIKPDLHEVEGYAQCKNCGNWFNHAIWEAHWKDKVNLAVDLKKIGRNDPCPCGSGLKYKKCCTPPKFRRWVIKNPEPFPPRIEDVNGTRRNETIKDRENRIENETDKV